ncbi:MAG: hypothetical protein ACLQCB_21850 [Spirochaetia bacterium]
MKEPLKLPFVFLFILICVTIILSAVTLLAAWGSTGSTAGPFDVTYLLEHFPGAAFGALIPSVVISMVLVGFRMARRPFSRLLGFLIVLAAGYVVLVNGMIWLSTLAGKARQQPQVTKQYLQPKTFLRLGTTVVAPATVAGDSLGGILVYDPNAAEGEPGTRGGAAVSPGNVTAPPDGLAVFAAASVSAQGGGLTVNLVGQTRRQVSGAPQAARAAVFYPDRVSAFFLRDIATLTNDFQRLMRRSLAEFFAACFALVFLCAASLALLRLTRWPLANVMLLLVAVRLYFLLYHLLATRFAATVASAVSDPFLARLFPSASFVVLGVVLLLIDILFIPAARWSGSEPA